MAIGGAACGNSAANSSDSVQPKPGKEAMVDDHVDSAAEILDEYVRLLDLGDVEAANDLRCPQNQFGADALQDLASMVEELRDDLGGSLIATKVEFQRTVGAASLMQLTLRNASEPIIVTADDRYGCLTAQEVGDASETLVEFVARGNGTADTTLSIEEVMDVPTGEAAIPSEVVTPQLDRTPLDAESLVASAFREWTTAAGDTIGVTALEFKTPDGADWGQLALESGYARNIVEVLDTDGPTSRGARHLAHPVTFVQPPGAGPLRDSLMARFGDKLVILTAQVPLSDSREPSVLLEAASRINTALSP